MWIEYNTPISIRWSPTQEIHSHQALDRTTSSAVTPGFGGFALHTNMDYRGVNRLARASHRKMKTDYDT